MTGSNRMLFWQPPLLFAVGIITGILNVLAHGLNLVRTNPVKVFVVFLYTSVALGVFVWHGEVNYALGFRLAPGNSTGGAMGVKLAVDKGYGWINGW